MTSGSVRRALRGSLIGIVGARARARRTRRAQQYAHEHPEHRDKPKYESVHHREASTLGRTSLTAERPAKALRCAAIASQPPSRGQSIDRLAFLSTVAAIEAMTSQGSPYARFRRALTNGNPLMITAACAELPSVSLADALEVCLVFRDLAPDRYGRAVARWLARYVSERHADDAEAAFLLACLRALTAPSCAAGAAHGLRVYLSRRGLAELARIVEGWAHRSGFHDN